MRVCFETASSECKGTTKCARATRKGYRLRVDHEEGGKKMYVDRG